jgi:ribosome-associated protein
MTSRRADDETDEHSLEPPSKSARKRAALAAQRLGERLIGFKDPELEALGLPERLVEAIREARRIKSRGAGARQRQLIGKLMREIDLTAVEHALAARDTEVALSAQRFHRVESWRERLIVDRDALDELVRTHPHIDRPLWEQAVAAARTEHASSGGGGAAARRLFQLLRALLEGNPGP